MNIVKLFQSWWNQSSSFRHGITAYVAFQVVAPIAQTGAWLQAHANHTAVIPPLPNFGSVAMDLVYGVGALVIAALVKALQNRKAFPPQPKNLPE